MPGRRPFEEAWFAEQRRAPFLPRLTLTSSPALSAAAGRGQQPS